MPFYDLIYATLYAWFTKHKKVNEEIIELRPLMVMTLFWIANAITAGLAAGLADGKMSFTYTMILAWGMILFFAVIHYFIFLKNRRDLAIREKYAALPDKIKSLGTILTVLFCTEGVLVLFAYAFFFL